MSPCRTRQLMRLALSFLLSFLFLGHVSAQTDDCQFQPISIPFKDVSLPHNGAIRGADLSIGTPPQQFSFTPVIDLNNTYVFPRSPECGTLASGDVSCMTRRGGFFIPDDSSTFQSAPDAASAGADTSETGTDGAWGKDNLILAPNVTSSDFPFQIPVKRIKANTTNDQASLGLGRNSTVLSMLKRASKIGSRTWGLWWGLAGLEEGARMDGSLVLGGYDAAKIKSERNHTGRLTEPVACPSGMTVTITALVLNFLNGSNLNILDPELGTRPLQGCLCPQCPIMMSLPLDPYYDRFESWTGTRSIGRSRGIDFFSMMYPANEVYQGDLTITLDSGLSLRIPNSQLVQPDLTFSESGEIIANTSVRNVMIYSLEGPNLNDISALGYYFLTAAYLFSDPDAGTFTLWEANPTTETNLVGVTDEESERACAASATTVGPASTASNSASTSTNRQGQQSETSSRLSGAAMGGIVVGAVAALAAVGISCFWLLRRRRRPDQPGAGGQLSGPEMQDWSLFSQERAELYGNSRAELSGGPPPELLGDPMPPQELWAGRNSRVHSMVGIR